MKPVLFPGLLKKASFMIAVIVVLVLLSAVAGHRLDLRGRKYVIGYIDPNPEEQEGAPGFLRNMPRHGYIEGRNVTYIKCESKDRKVIEGCVQDMVAKHVDLIMAMSTPAAKMAVKYAEGTDIKIVFIMYDAIGAGLIKSMVDHGNNITGVQLQGSTPKALEWLRTITPGARHIYVPVSFDTGAASQSLEKLRQSAEAAGFRLTVAEIKTVEELRAALASMPEDTDAVFLLHSWLVGSHVNEVVGAATERHIPVVSAGHVDYGHGLVMSFAPTDDSIGFQAARLAGKILEGTPPAHLPVENAEVFLGINLRSARAAGIEVPEAVLRRADHIIR